MDILGQILRGLGVAFAGLSGVVIVLSLGGFLPTATEVLIATIGIFVLSIAAVFGGHAIQPDDSDDG